MRARSSFRLSYIHVVQCQFTRTCINYSKLVYALRYEILEVIGKGSFGQVIRALDHKTGQHIAIKIIRYAETVYSSRDDSHRELRSEKKRRDVSAMNNVRYIRHFSGCVRFPSVPWRFLLMSAAFTVLAGTRRDSIIRLSSK